MLNQLRSWIPAIPALLGLLLVAAAQPVQQVPDKTINPIDTSTAFGAPKVQITEVKSVASSGGGFQVRVKWTAQTPNTTTLDKFEVFVSVRDSNGNTRTGTQTAVSTARELVVPVSITAKPVSFQANITTFFIPIAQTKSELGGTILLDKSNGFSGSGSTGQTTPQPAGDALTKLQLADNTDLKGFDVGWRLRIRTQDVRENQSKISGTFIYKKGNQVLGTRSVNATLGPGTRQTRLTVSSAPVSSLVDVKIEALIKIEVFFNLIQRTVTSLNGNFPTN